MKKSYNELITLDTFEERLIYLQEVQRVGATTFGGLRTYNQRLYRSQQWRTARNNIIIRDRGYDMALMYEEYLIHGVYYVHHIDPITPDDFRKGSYKLFDPNNLILVSDKVHKMIHYGGTCNIYKIIERHENDTIGWRPLKGG